MDKKIIGISGSPIKNSNIDRVIKRLWSLKHDHTLLKNKPWVTVINGLDTAALATANKLLAKKLTESDSVNLLGQITLSGNVPCNTCGKGEQCKTSAIHKMRKIANNNLLTINDFPYIDAIKDEMVNKEITKLASKIVSVI